MISWLAEKKQFQFWWEFWIQIILLQLYSCNKIKMTCSQIFCQNWNGFYPKYYSPHRWGHQVQKVATEAKFYIILFIMINALISCNFEKNCLGSFWDNSWIPRIFLKGQKDAVFIVINFLLYCVMAVFPLLMGQNWGSCQSDTRLRTKVYVIF